MKEIRLKRIKKYECSFLTLYEDDVQLPQKRFGKRVVIKHPGGACVLPILPNGDLILTKQYRYPIEQVSIEIPAGKKDVVGEDSLACAIRELEEETGYASHDIKHMFTLHPCVGYSDEKLDIFIAYDCYKVDQPKPMDEDESIELLIVDKAKAKEMLDSGLITDGKTIISIQYYMMNV
jgi:ADP-ribose pyrophosphatase